MEITALLALKTHDIGGEVFARAVASADLSHRFPEVPMQRTANALQPVRLRTCEVATLQQKATEIEHAIAQRAYDYFEQHGAQHGHDQEHWFRAESELLRPLPIVMSEDDDSVIVHANVLGFAAADLSIALDPLRIFIYGRRRRATRQPGDGKVLELDLSPDEVFRIIGLPTEIDPDRSNVEFSGGMLKFDLPKKIATRTKPARRVLGTGEHR
jgi:HSP20 family protein